MKTLLYVGLIFVVFSCKQARHSVDAPAPDQQVHRYSTVYEGNRVIKYHMSSASKPTTAVLDSVVTNDDQFAAEHHETAEITITTGQTSTNAFHYRTFDSDKLPLINELWLDNLQVKKQLPSTTEEDLPTYVGVLSFLVLIASGVILFFNIPQVALISLALGIMSLVLSIFAVVNHASDVDYTFGMVTLVLNLIGILILLLYLLAQLSA